MSWDIEIRNQGTTILLVEQNAVSACPSPTWGICVEKWDISHRAEPAGAAESQDILASYLGRRERDAGRDGNEARTLRAERAGGQRPREGRMTLCRAGRETGAPGEGQSALFGAGRGRGMAG